MHAELLANVGLTAGGTVTWGARVPTTAGLGVYIVSTPQPLDLAPIDDARLAGWIDRVPAMRVDGQAATVENLRARLDSFWIPGETVVYIGKATRSLATRIGQYYRTPLGDRAPHAGGHWIKTLSILDDLRVTWAEAEDPSTSEDDLLRAFAELVSKEAAANLPAGPILPFANLETAGGVRKGHGISGSRRPGT